jgi:hypothetical protein
VSDDLTEEFAADAAWELEGAALQEALERLAAMGKQLVEAAAKVEEAEAALRKAKDDHARLERADMPNLMRELKLTEVRLDDKTLITCKEEVQGAISEERRAAAHAWLREHHFGGLIRCAVSVPFGADEGDASLAAAKQISEELGRETSVDERVHPQTLKSFVKERLAAGDEDFPRALFGVFTFDRAVVKLPKR